MVDFRSLSNMKGDRKVREVVFAEGETIKVYEPDKDDIDKIIEFQEKYIDPENLERIKISGEDILTLFTILTDIEGLEDLKEEEVQQVINNPSLAFLQVQHVVEGIVTEVGKMVILSAKNRILEADLQLETARTSRDVLEKTLGLAEREGETAEMAKRVRVAQKKVTTLEEYKNRIANGEPLEDEAVEEEPIQPVKQIERHANELAHFQNVFADTEEEVPEEGE